MGGGTLLLLHQQQQQHVLVCEEHQRHGQLPVLRVRDGNDDLLRPQGGPSPAQEPPAHADGLRAQLDAPPGEGAPGLQRRAEILAEKRENRRDQDEGETEEAEEEEAERRHGQVETVQKKHLLTVCCNTIVR